MTAWSWLQGAFTWTAARQIALRTILFFALVNLVYFLAQPLDALDKVSIYNSLVPGRGRFSFYLKDAAQYNGVSVTRYAELFAGHEISAASPKSYNVVLLGDSSVWGFGLGPDDTLSACLNQKDAQAQDGRRIHVYNLGYPMPDAFRDLIFLNRALNAYPVDQVVWIVNGLGMYRPRLLDHDDLQHNPADVYPLLDRFAISIPPDIPRPDRSPSLTERSLFAQRAELAAWLKDQLYGLVWLQTHQDNVPFTVHYQPKNVDELGDIFDVVATGLPYLHPQTLPPDTFLTDVLEAGRQLAAQKGIPLAFRLQPMWRAPPGTSQLRYNVYYPFWYFDQLRAALSDQAARQGWDYADWSARLDNRVFTDSPFHYDREAACQLADLSLDLIRHNEK